MNNFCPYSLPHKLKKVLHFYLIFPFSSFLPAITPKSRGVRFGDRENCIPRKWVSEELGPKNQEWGMATGRILGTIIMGTGTNGVR